MYRRIFPLLLTMVLSLTADILVTRTEKLHGMLNGFAGGKFTFMEFSKDEPTIMPVEHVIKIELDRGTKANLFLDAHAKKAVSGLLRGYKKGKFYVTIQNKKQKLTPRHLPKLTINYSLMDFQEARDQWTEDQRSDNDANPRKAKAYAVEGKVTIVHFNDDSASSRRQGNLCQRLAQQNPTRIQYVIVNAPLGSRVAKLNRITSTPQFWFFAQDRSLREKLVNRFTEEDITQTAEKIRKGR